MICGECDRETYGSGTDACPVHGLNPRCDVCGERTHIVEAHDDVPMQVCVECGTREEYVYES